MRPIKFRGWDGQVMYYDNSVINFPDRWQPMQFTGLLDKNGKEIYEGDIVKIEDEGSYEVKYFGDTGYPAFDLKGWDSEINGLSMLSESGEYEYEVIGNVYENPDLFNGQQGTASAFQDVA